MIQEGIDHCVPDVRAEKGDAALLSVCRGVVDAIPSAARNLQHETAVGSRVRGNDGERTVSALQLNADCEPALGRLPDQHPLDRPLGAGRITVQEGVAACPPEGLAARAGPLSQGEGLRRRVGTVGDQRERASTDSRVSHNRS